MVLHTGNYISLCSGIGGLDLGVKAAFPNARCVCYVERESFAASVLVARMEDSSLDKAPVWSDLTTFDCAPWRGSVDFVVAGFPCQPVSVAGRRKGEGDERWIWEHVIRVVREVGCRYVFLENVAGLLSMGCGRVLGDLAQSGFDAEYMCIHASDVGAPHKRSRWFCLAHSTSGKLSPEVRGKISGDGFRSHGKVDDTDIAGLEGWREHQSSCERVVRKTGDEKVNSISGSSQRRRERGELEEAERLSRRKAEGRSDESGFTINHPSESIFPPQPGSELWRHVADEAQPAICGVAHGTSERLDRLRALGNGVVPLQAAVALRELSRRLQ